MKTNIASRLKRATVELNIQLTPAERQAMLYTVREVRAYERKRRADMREEAMRLAREEEDASCQSS